MLRKIINHNPLFFAFFLLALTDGVLTLIGQGVDYWDHLRTVNEASPAYYFLKISPWLYIFAAIAWLFLWYFLIKKLKRPFDIFFVFLFIAGHSWGSSTWIMRIFKRAGIYTLSNQPSIIFAWSLLILYFFLISAIATYCLEVYIKERK